MYLNIAPAITIKIIFSTNNKSVLIVPLLKYESEKDSPNALKDKSNKKIKVVLFELLFINSNI